MSVYFYFIFSHSNLFWFNFWYVARLFYLKIGKSSNSANYSYKCCFGIDEIKNRPVVFTSTFLGKNSLTRQTRCTFNLSRANLNGPIRNTFIVFSWNQSETILLQGSPELLISLFYMRRRALGRDCFSPRQTNCGWVAEKKENLKRWKVLEVSKFTYKLRNHRFQTAKGKSTRHH